VRNLRNYFEGPINLDLMMLGIVKNLGLHQGTIPDIDKAKALGKSLLYNIVYSAQAIQAMQNSEMNVGYQILQQAVKPHVKAICFQEQDMSTFNALLADIETYFYAK
jgi:hypothetical protein